MSAPPPPGGGGDARGAPPPGRGPPPLRLVDLPRDVLLHVSTYLHARDLLALGSACAELRATADTDALWRAFLRSDFEPSRQHAAWTAVWGAKSAYARAWREAAGRARHARQLAAVEAAALAGQVRHMRALACLNATNAAPLAAAPALLITWLALLAGKLDGPLAGWSWWAVFFPVWALLGAAGAALGATLAAEARSPQLLADAQGGPVAALVRTAVGQGHGRGARAHLVALAAAAAALPLTVTLRLQLGGGGGGAPGFSWALALLPLWVGLGLHACAPCAGSGLVATPGRRQAHALLWACVLAPTLASCVALAVSLDGGGAGGGLSIPLHLVLIPFWVVNGALACMGVLLVAHAAVLACTRRAGPGALGQFSAALLGFAAVLAPPGVFLVLLATRVDAPPASAAAALPWRSVLAPLFFWLAVGCAVALVAAPAALHDGCAAHLRAARRLADAARGGAVGGPGGRPAAGAARPPQHPENPLTPRAAGPAAAPPAPAGAQGAAAAPPLATAV